MRAEYLSSSFSEDSGNDSDSSTSSARKRVQFYETTPDTADKATAATEKRRSDVSRKAKRFNCFKASSIDRGDIPDGSDVFQQALKEIQTQESDRDGQKDSSAKCQSPPLKSILKKR